MNTVFFFIVFYALQFLSQRHLSFERNYYVGEAVKNFTAQMWQISRQAHTHTHMQKTLIQTIFIVFKLTREKKSNNFPNDWFCGNCLKRYWIFILIIRSWLLGYNVSPPPNHIETLNHWLQPTFWMRISIFHFFRTSDSILRQAIVWD